METYFPVQNIQHSNGPAIKQRPQKRDGGLGDGQAAGIPQQKQGPVNVIAMSPH